MRPPPPGEIVLPKPAKRTLVFPTPNIPTMRMANAPILELSSSELVPQATPTPLPVAFTAHVASVRPPSLPSRGRARRLAFIVAPSLALVAVIALLVARQRPSHREARAAVSEVSPLATEKVARLPAPPSRGCTTTGDARVLASHALLGAGLDVSVLDAGFGLALASSRSEATALRLESTRLRVVEKVRAKTGAIVSHAVVEDDETDGLGVRVDPEEARSVIGSVDGSLPFRVVVHGNGVAALIGKQPKFLWPLPRAKARTDLVRAAHRTGGGAAVAVRRTAGLWLGFIDPSFEATSPLIPLVRKGVSIGTPAVAAWGAGGAVAWSERGAGDREWTVFVAGFLPNGDVPTIRSIGKGISPTLAALPDGDLLLAWATGGAGAHRVVAERLGPELEPRGEVLAVSPPSFNAGQPVAAVRPDGRAMVAFFAARPYGAAVVGTSLSCDPGL